MASIKYGTGPFTALVVGLTLVVSIPAPAAAEMVEDTGWQCVPDGPCAFMGLERLGGAWFTHTFQEMPDAANWGAGLDWVHRDLVPYVGYIEPITLFIHNPITGLDDPYQSYKLVLGSTQIVPPPSFTYVSAGEPTFLGPVSTDDFPFLITNTPLRDITVTIGFIRVWVCTVPNEDSVPAGGGPGGQCTAPSSPGDIPEVAIET